jgi:hypothetical protein
MSHPHVPLDGDWTHGSTLYVPSSLATPNPKFSFAFAYFILHTFVIDPRLYNHLLDIYFPPPIPSHPSFTIPPPQGRSTSSLARSPPHLLHHMPTLASYSLCLVSHRRAPPRCLFLLLSASAVAMPMVHCYGATVTPRVMKSLITFIRPLIKRWSCD